MKDTSQKTESAAAETCSVESCSCPFKLAELPESCQTKIHEFEQELNKHGFWNIALVAYQKIE